MLKLIVKFVSWVINAFSLIISLPGQIASIVSSFAGYLSFLPNGLGTIIVGLLLTLVFFFVVYAIVKLVASLL